MADEDIDELKAKYICFRCIGEDYLQEEIKRGGKRQECSYCQTQRRCYSVNDMADRIEHVFEQHFIRTSTEPTAFEQAMISDKESTYNWDREGEDVVDAIENAADFPRAAAEDIQAILEGKHSDFDAAAMGEETEFSSESRYTDKGVSDVAWQEEWRNFEDSLKTEARFFSRSAARHLASIFGGIDRMAASDGRHLVIDGGPEAEVNAVYRARVFQSDDTLEVALCRPDQHLGSPSMAQARAGRMNAAGISVFYGCNEPGVAIAEVRPPVGSQVAVARFNIIRPLRLLDLTALSAVSESGSIFDETFAHRLERATFLRALAKRITKPVMPDDEAFEYLPTQAIADFLATENEPRLDGIVFPSIQAAGDALNFVLFHKSARVKPLDIPEGTEITASTGSYTEDGWEVDYSVREEFLPQRWVNRKRNIGRSSSFR